MKTKWALLAVFVLAGALFFVLFAGTNGLKQDLPETTSHQGEARSEDVLSSIDVVRSGEVVLPRTVSADRREAPRSEERPKTPDRLKVPKGKAYLALVVDDCGYNLPMLRTLLATKLPVTIAVLPHARYAAQTAQLATEANVPFLIHMPMQAKGDADLAPGMLGVGMPEDEKRAFVEKTLVAFPQAFGVNNHRGSKATEDRATMDLLMEELSKRGLFFLDSRTSSLSVAYRAASDAGLRALRNGFFLDNTTESKDIAARFGEAVRLAEKKGYLIAICHLRPHTVAFLEMLSSGKKGGNVRLVSLPELLEEGEKP